MKKISISILARIQHLAEVRGTSLKAMLVGSAARDTWLSGDHDLDIFIGVPEGASLEEALAVAKLVAPNYEEKYAQHAYIHARMNGFEVDLVPCYLVEDTSKLKSAVDRTPFHTRYITHKISGLEDEVRLLKQFMKGVNVYGSELKTGGFSGYLAELLILRYGSLLAVLRAASNWKPGEIIDLESHSSAMHNEPMVVVDPVDPRRNVAAALTIDKMFQFAAASRCFLAQPRLDFFFPMNSEPLSDEELLARISARDSNLILIDFKSPQVVDDVLYPQLRKAEGSLRALLVRHGFSPLRSDVSRYHDRAGILIELEIWILSKVSQRVGPPLWEPAHVSRFLASHPTSLSGPYIIDGRCIVDIPRKYTRVQDLLATEMPSLSLGKHLSVEICKGYNIYVDQELVKIKDRDFRTFLTQYFRPEYMIC